MGKIDNSKKIHENKVLFVLHILRHMPALSFLKEVYYHFLSVRKALGLQSIISVASAETTCNRIPDYPMACRSSSLWTGMVSFPRKRLMIGRLLARPRSGGGRSRGDTQSLRSGAAAGRSYPTPKARGGNERSDPEPWLRGRRRA